MQTVIIKASGLCRGDWFIPSLEYGKPEQVEFIQNNQGAISINHTHFYDASDVVDLIV